MRWFKWKFSSSTCATVTEWLSFAFLLLSVAKTFTNWTTRFWLIIYLGTQAITCLPSCLFNYLISKEWIGSRKLVHFLSRLNENVILGQWTIRSTVWVRRWQVFFCVLGKSYESNNQYVNCIGIGIYTNSKKLTKTRFLL